MQFIYFSNVIVHETLYCFLYNILFQINCMFYFNLTRVITAEVKIKFFKNNNTMRNIPIFFWSTLLLLLSKWSVFIFLKICIVNFVTSSELCSHNITINIGLFIYINKRLLFLFFINSIMFFALKWINWFYEKQKYVVSQLY